MFESYLRALDIERDESPAQNRRRDLLGGWHIRVYRSDIEHHARNADEASPARTTPNTAIISGVPGMVFVAMCVLRRCLRVDPEPSFLHYWRR